MSVNLASNGFSYADIETTKLQRVKRVMNELNGSGSLTIGEIKTICKYTQNKNAMALAKCFVKTMPDKFYFNPVPKEFENEFEEEIEKGILRKKAYKTEPIELVKRF